MAFLYGYFAENYVFSLCNVLIFEKSTADTPNLRLSNNVFNVPMIIKTL